MKVFLDSNVYVAETLLGRGAERIISATVKARGEFTAAGINSKKWGA